MRKPKDPEKTRKRKKRIRLIIEIAIMTLGVLCAIMPYPWTLLVPIGIGVRRIIIEAIRKEKESPAPSPVVYCNGEREPKRTKSASAKSAANLKTTTAKKSTSRS